MRAAVLYSKVSHFSDEVVKYNCSHRRREGTCGVVQVTAAPILCHGTRWCEWSGSRRDGSTPGEIPLIMMDKTPTHALFTQHYISLAC